MLKVLAYFVYVLDHHQVELDSLQHRATEIVGRLVCRPEDSEMRVKQDIQYYREAMLRSLEDYIIQHNQQHVIELDANLAPRDLFRVNVLHHTSAAVTVHVCKSVFDVL